MAIVILRKLIGICNTEMVTSLILTVIGTCSAMPGHVVIQDCTLVVIQDCALYEHINAPYRCQLITNQLVMFVICYGILHTEVAPLAKRRHDVAQDVTICLESAMEGVGLHLSWQGKGQCEEKDSQCMVNRLCIIYGTTYNVYV